MVSHLSNLTKFGSILGMGGLCSCIQSIKKENPLKRNQNPSRHYNSIITNFKFQYKPNVPPPFLSTRNNKLLVPSNPHIWGPYEGLLLLLLSLSLLWWYKDNALLSQLWYLPNMDLKFKKGGLWWVVCQFGRSYLSIVVFKIYNINLFLTP